MEPKAQGGTEYLFAIGLSFLLTLLVMSSLVGFTQSAKDDIRCNVEKCPPAEKPPESAIKTNVVLFVITLVIFYFIEFFFVVMFLKLIGRSKKKALPPHSKF